MSDLKRNVIVGLTAMAGIGGLVALVLIFGALPYWLSKSYLVTVNIDDATGIANGSRIKLNGVDVGYVDGVSLGGDLASGVSVKCMIEERIDLPKSATVSASSGVLSSAATLSISVEKGADLSESLPKDGTAVVVATTGSIGKEVQRAVARMESELFGQLEMQLKNFGAASKAIVKLTEEYTKVGTKLNDLLSQQDPADVDSGKAKANITTVVARVDRRVKEMRETVAKVNALLGDEKMLADIRATVRNARGFTVDAKKLTGDAREAIGKLTGRVDELTKQYVAVADRMSGTLGRVDKVLAKVDGGKGTLGMLLNDPALYRSLNDAGDRLGDTLTEMKLLIMKLKKEGINIRF